MMKNYREKEKWLISTVKNLASLVSLVNKLVSCCTDLECSRNEETRERAG